MTDTLPGFELRARFRGFRSGGYTYAKVGTSREDPIRVKTFEKPAPAAKFAAAALGGRGLTVEALLQYPGGNQEITVYDGQKWTALGLDLLRALASDDECALADLIGRTNKEELR